MKAQMHGITSLGLIVIAVTIASAIMFKTSLAVGFMYLIICIVATASILYVFCAKCPCREKCSHVIPGKATRVFKNRMHGPYKPFDLIVTGLALLLLIGVPQPWLLTNIKVFAVFWVIVVIAVIQIRTVVCKACKNIYCPGVSKSNMSDSLK